MILRKAQEMDIPALCDLYRIASDQLATDGVDQWKWGEYPNETIVAEDVRNGRMYCLYGAQGMVAAVAVGTEASAAYRRISWLFGVRPGVFHRLAIHPELQGTGLDRQAEADVETILIYLGCDSIRCDTAEGNHYAERFYESMGMRRAGRVWFEDRQKYFVGYEKRLTEHCPLLPITMHPAFRGGTDTPWGGDRLREVFHKEPPESPTGESLEVSCIPGLESTDDSGVTLPDLIHRYGAPLVGRFSFAEFPLLLKLIDARDRLSVQVHPHDGDPAAREEERSGKTEAWLILDAPPEAQLVYGLKPGTSLDELRAASEQGKAVETLLRRVPVTAGDICYIPAGCVHAIDAGMLIYEIQQSSDVTYRFYDWDRADAQGRKRKLHLDKALSVTDLTCAPRPVRASAIPVARVLDKPYFTLDILQPEEDSPVHVPHIRDFGLLTALEDGMTLVWEGMEKRLKKGTTLFLPCSAPSMCLMGNGRCALSMPR